MKRAILFLLLALIVFWGCEKKIEKTDIVFLGTLSGRYSDLGQATLQGVMLAIENSSNPSSINLIVKDDFGKPSEGMKIIKELEDTDVKYIIGPNLSSVATSVVPMLESKGLYMISPTTSTSSLAGKKDNFLRTMPHNNYKQAETISRYLIKTLNINNAVVLYDSRNASYSNDIVMKFTEAFMREGGEVKDVRSFNPDAGESLNKLIEPDTGNPPAMYYIIGSSMDTSLIIWQIKKAGFPSEILIRGWAASNEFFRLGGEAIEGVKLFDFYTDKETEGYLKFAKSYRERFQKEASWMGIYGYESARILIDSLPQLKSGASFQDAMNNSAVHNRLLLNFKFDEFGDAFLPLHFFIINNGEAVHQDMVE